MNKKRIGSILLAFMLSLSLAACGNGNSSSSGSQASGASQGASSQAEQSAPTEEPGADTGLTTDNITLTMSWWGGESRAEATQAAIDKFTEKYPNIKVDSTFNAWSGWEDAMGLAFATDTAQDIVQINWNWIYNFGSNGNVFYDLYQVADVLDLSQFPESSLKASELDGKLQGVPIAMTARNMFWNKNTFDKAGMEIPTTWEELLASGETMKAALGDDYYPMMLTEYDRMIFMIYYLESVYNKPWVVNNEIQYTEAEIAEGFAMMRELEEKHVMPTVKMIKEYSADPLDKSDRWINGYWPGVYTWNTSHGPLVSAIPEDQRAGLVAAGMFEGLANKGGFNKISMEFAITQTCQYPREAAALINFMLNEEEGIIAMSGERGVPASAIGFKIASENNIVDQLTVDATNFALNSGWNTFELDPYFEHNDLKNNPEGAYYKIFSAQSYGNMTDAEAAAQLVSAINAVMTAEN